MSFSFYMDARGRTISWGAMARGLADPACVEDDVPPDDPLEEGAIIHIYEPTRSARGVEVALNEGRVQVRFVVPSAPEDYLLGLRVIENTAKALGAKVEAEDEETPFPASELRKRYGGGWVKEQTEGGLICLFEDDEGLHALSGPLRTVHIGKRLRSAFRGLPEKERPKALFDLIRRAQYLDLDEWFQANAMLVRTKDGRERTVAAFGSDCNYLFPPVDFLAVLPRPADELEDSGEGEPAIEVPFDALPGLVGDHASFLDEQSLLVRGFSADEWPEVVARAKRLAVSAGGASSKRWWEFWK